MKRKHTKIVLVVLINIIILAFLYWNRGASEQSPFEDCYVFEAISQVSLGSDGYTYAIDNGKKTVFVLNEDKKLVRKITGGNENAHFYYAEKICADSLGNIYVADTISGEQGNRIQKERIIKIEKQSSVVLMEFDYANSDRVPLQYGDILKLQEYHNDIYFLKEGQEQISVYKIIGETQQVELLGEYPCPYYISDASYDVNQNIVYITTRLGQVCFYNEKEAEWIELPKYAAEQMPWSIGATDGEVYFTDLKAKAVYHYSIGTMEIPNLVFKNDEVLYGVFVSPDGQNVLVTDNAIFFQIDTDSNSVQSYEQCLIGNQIKIILYWLLCAFLVIEGVMVMLPVVRKVLRELPNKAGMGRIVLVVGSSIVVSIIASYSTVSVLMSRHDEMIESNMQVFADSMRLHIDEQLLGQLNNTTDYRSDAYLQLKKRLDKQIEVGYEKGVYYYYILCTTDGEYINCLMDYEDSMGCGHPLYLYGDNEYTRVFTTGESYTVSEMSSYGSWMFILLPITDSEGNVIAELEVGSNLDTLMQQKSDLIKENIITVLCSCGVMIMLILEAVFAISFYEKRKVVIREKWDITQQMPIRIMVFLVYLTDSMQDAFIAILCSKLYADNLPISREMAIALPMSVQLLMAAIFSMVGGAFVGKLGIKKNMQLGLFSQLLGFAICMLIPDYMGILTGKLFIGTGMGIVYVTCNTMASMGGDNDFVENAFADVSAGVLSGVTIGAGVGSIVLAFANYRAVYLVGAILLGAGLLLTFSAQNIKFEAKTGEKVNTVDMLKFVLNRRVIFFFICILVPFMMALSYREYFFPLYVEQFGIDEVQIGRIYLGCGVLVLYIGPFLSKRILKLLGVQKSILFASLCMAGNMALFVIFPNIYSVMIGMVIFALIISFAYTCQYTYFESLDECSQVGMGNAMGIYSMFENVGQTLGPMVYGAALMLGNRKGIMVLFLSMLVLAIIYSKMELKRGEKRG